MKKYCLILLAFIALNLIAYPVKITSWNIRDDIKRLNTLNICIDNVKVSTQSIFADLKNESEASLLHANGFEFEKLPEIHAGKLLNDIDNQSVGQDSVRSYYTLAEYNSFMINTAAQFPGICQLVQFGSSVQNRPLYFMRISDNVAIQEDEPEFRLVSSIHGNEVVGYDILIRLIQLLTSGYGNDLRITNIVNNTELWICPMFNPDGYAAAQRYNANGSDLNRNFPLPVGSQHPDGLSWQPETIAFMDHASANNVTLSINYHCGTMVVNYPWDYTYTLAPDNNLLIQSALTYSSHNSPMYNSAEFPQGITNGAAWYVALGTLQDWSYAYTSGVDMTIEVSNENWPNESLLDNYWNDNQESLLSLIEFVQLGIHGIVTDNSGNPIHATISFNGAGETTYTDMQVGDYHKVLLPGSYSVSAQADGYTIANAQVVVPAGGTAVQNFVLEPLAFTNISGKVVNLSGTIIPNISGQFTYGSSTFDFQTDGQGGFAVSNLPLGIINVTINASTYGFYRGTLEVSDTNKEFIFVLPTPIFVDGFENGISNWTLQNPWSVVNFSNTHVLTDSPSGNYNNNMNVFATLTNSVSLINMQSPTLSYEIRYNLETNYDFLYVQVSTNGTTWNTIKEYTGSVSNWVTEAIILDNYTGSDLFLRYNLVTDNSVTADGVYIDNVKFSGLSGEQTVYGDTDSNWLIDFHDVQNIMEYCVGNDPIPEIDPIPWEIYRIESADVDNDNIVSATDAFYIYSKLNQYNDAFPVQGGLAFTFEDPLFSLNITDSNTINVTSQNFTNLKSCTLDFSASESLDVNQLTFNPALENVLTTINPDFNRLSLLSLDNAVLYPDIAAIQFNSENGIIHCTGQVNDTDIDVLLTSAFDDNVKPVELKLIGNTPNPFVHSTEIVFQSPKNDTKVLCRVYNIKGQLVKYIAPSDFNKGINKISFRAVDDSGRCLSNGIYFYVLQTPDKSLRGKMMIIK
jgi:hypothetical protein